MTRDEVIRLAREAGFLAWGDQARLERFAALVAAHEREACAAVVEKYAKANEESDIMAHAFLHCAAAIRARGNDETVG